MAIYDAQTSTPPAEASGLVALLVILAVLSTLVLDAYAFSVFVSS